MTKTPQQARLDLGLRDHSIASPLCVYQKPCPRNGRALLGKPEDLDGCINRSILCVTCGATGVQSTNTERKR